MKNGTEKERSARKVQRTFEEVNLAAMTTQRKTEKDFERFWMLVVGHPKEKYPTTDQVHVPLLE